MSNFNIQGGTTPQPLSLRRSQLLIELLRLLECIGVDLRAAPRNHVLTQACFVCLFVKTKPYVFSHSLKFFAESECRFAVSFMRVKKPSNHLCGLRNHQTIYEYVK